MLTDFQPEIDCAILGQLECQEETTKKNSLGFNTGARLYCAGSLAHMETLCLTVRNRLDEIGPLARDAATFLESHQVDRDATFTVDLALEEIVSNVMKHAHGGADSDQISVRIDVGQDRIILSVEDSGPPFNPLELPEPDLDVPVDQRPIGGLGVFLVRKTVDHMEYERKGNRNVLRVIVIRHHA